MSLLIRGGTVLDSTHAYRADVLCDKRQDRADRAEASTRRPARRSSTPAIAT